MRIATTIARVLLGVVFVVFGLNMFLHFIPMPPPTLGSPAESFGGSLVQTHYMHIVHGLEIAGGLLLISGRFVPLGLTVLGAIIVNIDLFHLLMAPAGLPMSGILTALSLFLLWRYRDAFAGLVRA